MDRNVNIITELDGKKIVLINDIRFKAKKERRLERCRRILERICGGIL